MQREIRKMKWFVTLTCMKGTTATEESVIWFIGMCLYVWPIAEPENTKSKSLNASWIQACSWSFSGRDITFNVILTEFKISFQQRVFGVALFDSCCWWLLYKDSGKCSPIHCMMANFMTVFPITFKINYLSSEYVYWDLY